MVKVLFPAYVNIEGVCRSFFMYFHEPLPFHMAYPVTGCYEQEKVLEEEHALLLSYFSGNVQTLQNRIEAEIDIMESEGSMIYDERPDQGTIRRISDRLWTQWENEYPSTVSQETVYMLVVLEIFRRRARKRRADNMM